MKHPYVRAFFHRGLLFGGFGPIVMGIIYLILSYTVPDFSVSGGEVFTAVLSTYLLAFVHAGASIFNQIEHWSLGRSLACHLGTLYAAYTVCYLVNTWIPFEPLVLLIFTGIFLLVYFVVWLTVWLCIQATGKKLNTRI